MAEVLITLGIIGVVAAMTLPALVQNYKKKEYSVRLKRFYSVMNQALKMSEVENGDILNWDYQGALKKPDGTFDVENTSSTMAFVNKYIKPYLKGAEVEDSVTMSNLDDTTQLSKYKLVAIKFNDGSIVYMKNGDCLDMYYDVNGESGPNKSGYDRYNFGLALGGIYRRVHGEKHKPFIAWGSSPNNESVYNDMDAQLNACKSNGVCTRYLQLNNFEYPDEYPYKL